MKKFLSFVTSVVLVATMLPITLVQFEVPVVSAAACEISTDTNMTAAYTGACDGITVTSNATLTFYGDALDIGTGTSYDLTINEGVTVTWSGTGVFADSDDDVIINGIINHADEDTGGVAMSASGNVTVGSTGSINVNAKGCQGLYSNNDGKGPNANTGVCEQHGPGHGDGANERGAGGGHGGAGGDANNGGEVGGSTHGSSTVPITLGSSGGGPYTTWGADGGGRIWLDISGIFTVNGAISADGDDGKTDGARSGGAGSGGSIYINAGTLAGSSTISADGGDGYDAASHDGGGGGGGRVAVIYDTLSGFTITNISAANGVAGAGGSGNPEDGENGTTYIIDETNNDLRVIDGLSFEDEGDYTRRNITIDSGTNVYCAEAMTDLNIGASGEFVDGGSTFTCSSAVTNFNLSASGSIALTNITWSITNTSNGYFSADNTLTTGGTANTITFNKSGAQMDWNISNNMTLNNLTYTMGNAGTSSGSGGLFTIDNAITIDLVNTDIVANAYWVNLTGLSVDYDSSISSNNKGCPGLYSNQDGQGPNVTTGVCEQHGPGHGDGANERGAGGGHGGAGGDANNGGEVGGSTHGSNTAPVTYGASSGGPYTTWGSNGGGKIWLDVDGTLTLNGTISSDGQNGQTDGFRAGGGGSGGSVYLDTTSLAGTGSVSAAGGNGYDASSHDGGGGGGGRVAIYYGSDSSTFLASLTSATAAPKGLKGGTSGNPEDGSDGTLYTLQRVILDSIVIQDSSGYTNDTTPFIDAGYSGATPTHIAFSCDNSNWSSWLAYPTGDDRINDINGPEFDITTGATNCSATEELKTIYAKIKDANGESSVVSDTTTYDLTAPTVSNVTSSDSNGTYTTDDTITVNVEFDESVTITSGTPTLGLAFDGDDRSATYSTGSGTTTLAFTYTIVSGDNTSDLDYNATDALAGIITDLAGNSFILTGALATPGESGSLGANKDIVVSTNESPTAATLTASQSTVAYGLSGLHIVDASFVMDDPDDDDTLQAQVEVNAGTGWIPAVMGSTVTATYGSPVIDNSQTYQVGQASGYITSSSGANTVVIQWAPGFSYDGLDTSSVQMRVTPYDGTAAGTTVTSNTFVLDQVAPTGGFTETYTTSINETSVSIGWDPITTETNFAQYTVYYKRSSADTYSSAGTLNTMSTSASSIIGLVAGVSYNVYVQAADDYGNTTNSPVLTFTTSQEGEGTTSSNTVSQAGGGSSSSSSSTSTSTSDSTDTSTDTNTGDSDQNAGEGETGDPDYTPPSDTVEEPSDSTTEDTTVEELVETPVEEVVVEEPIVEEEPEDYISAPLEETPDEIIEEPVEEHPTSVGVFDEIEQEIYEDVAVITYEDKTIEIQITTEEIEEKITEEVIESDKDLKQIFKDKDSDGIPDIWEETNLNDTDFDGTADTDGDGLTDLEEYFNGSDPLDADTDNDGLSDIVEASLNLSSTSWDTDGDGISDDEEIFNNQDPTTPEQKDIDPVLYDEQNDSDGDGLSDYMEKYYNTDPYSADSDNDGIDDIEELFLDTNPNKTDHVEELDTKITNHKGTTSTSSNVLIRGTATEDPTIYIVNDKDEIVSTIEAEIDEEGKFAITNDEDLPDGEYKLLIATEEDFSTGTLNIDTTQQKEQPELEQTPEETQFTGKAEPNAIIYATWKSLILSSVIVADSQTGDFTLDPPSALEEGEHTVYVYTQDQETNTTSETLQVNFTITQSNVLHESAAQREADEKGFPYMTLILFALIAMGASFVLLKRNKSQQQEERELIKKL